MMTPYFLAIEGPIGVGKTTLARLLKPRFKANLLLEAFEENPFLSNFYSDRARYAFQTQMFFLLSRYRQQQEIPSLVAGEPLIGDYTFGKDALFARLNLEGDELEMYRRLYTVLADRVVLPDLVIYLQADTDALMARIAARDRPYEREMDREYMSRVAAAYEKHFSNYTSTPLLTIDTNDLNYVRDSSALAFVEGRVRRALGIGAYQQSLPKLEELGRAQIQPPPRERVSQAPGENIVTDFLAANEAMGRLGALLAEKGEVTSEKQLSRLKMALRQVMGRLSAVQDSLGGDQDHRL
ncbi:MAG: deoxynucleoside kinase [Anaerolineae bacterium]|jgi:deoxyguanosine kinase